MDEYDTTRIETYDPYPPEDRDPASGRHPVNIGHLVMGIAFLGLVGVWALLKDGAIGSGDLRWFLPLPWLAAGLAGLLVATVGSRRRDGGR